MLSADATACAGSVVFLLDVDDTLLDNDRFASDLRARLVRSFGDAGCASYWKLYEALREQQGYADYLGALQAFRVQCCAVKPEAPPSSFTRKRESSVLRLDQSRRVPDFAATTGPTSERCFRAGADTDSDLLEMSAYMLDYPFAERLYPQALAAIAHLRRFGLPVILSDGDVVFQPHKIRRSGLWDAVGGRVLIFLHKERMLSAIEQRFPASHYVMVDDKPQVLAAMKRALGARLSTVFVKQGHYAAAAENEPVDPPPDLVIERIGALCGLDLTHLVAATAPPTQESA